jgi:Na+/glutamate symporter
MLPDHALRSTLADLHGAEAADEVLKAVAVAAVGTVAAVLMGKELHTIAAAVIYPWMTLIQPH